MKKFLQLIGSLIIPLYLAIDKFGFSDYLKKNYSDTHANFMWWGLLIVAVGTVIATWVTSYYIPEKKYQNALKSKDAFLKSYFLKNIDNLKVHDYEVTFNVMKEKKYWGFISLYSNWKKNIFPKIYECIFRFPDSNTIPLKFILGVDQGTNGLSIVENGVRMYGIHGKTKETICSDLNVNDKQYTYISKSTFLASIPVRPNDDKGNSKFVGVLTLESKSKGMEKIDLSFDLSNEKEQDKLHFEQMRLYIPILMTQLADSYGLLAF